MYVFDNTGGGGKNEREKRKIWGGNGAVSSGASVRGTAMTTTTTKEFVFAIPKHNKDKERGTTHEPWMTQYAFPIANLP